MTLTIRTVAPAKINLSLEILGLRDDGYHEIRSVMQTIDIIDELTLSQAPALSLAMNDGAVPSDDDLVLQAAKRAADDYGFPPRGSFRLTKRIPIAAGLGGGSSDAAAAVRLLGRLQGLQQSARAASETVAKISSDASFFCFGGTALVKGRGEIIDPLPDVEPFWIVVVTPPTRIPSKTSQMYDLLGPNDFTDGTASVDLAARIKAGRTPTNADLCNGFDRAAYEAFDGLSEVRESLRNAGAEVVHLTGSGPTLFTLIPTEDEALAICSRLEAPDCRVNVARTLTAAKSTAVDRPRN